MKNLKVAEIRGYEVVENLMTLNSYERNNSLRSENTKRDKVNAKKDYYDYLSDMKNYGILEDDDDFCTAFMYA